MSNLIENTNIPNNSSVIETIIKNSHIFNNISLASKSKVIKVSPHLDMAIIWIDIWDIQSGSIAKYLINRCFNIGSFIAIVQEANMNLSVLQCKNC